MKVFINPGHAANGEPDPGAVHNFFNFRECDIALSIGKLVKRFLLRAGCYVEMLQSHNLNGEVTGYGKVWWSPPMTGERMYLSVFTATHSTPLPVGRKPWYMT